MNFNDFGLHIANYKSQGKKIFATSSFQTQSVALLHMISKIDNTIPIYFINTGYLFPETIIFKDKIAKEFNLKIIDTKPLVPKNLQKDSSGNLLFTSNPDYCCYLNKIQPLDNVLAEHDIWINGIRADQSDTRKQMSIEQKAPFNVTRFHPMLDWSKQMVYQYIKEYNLPKNPLDDKGYLSVGCEPCTRKYNPEMGERAARWFGMKKTECGLHTELVVK